MRLISLFLAIFVLTTTAFPTFADDGDNGDNAASRNQFRVIPTDTLRNENRVLVSIQKDDGTFERGVSEGDPVSEMAMRFDFSQQADVTSAEFCWLSGNSQPTFDFSFTFRAYDDPGGLPGAPLMSFEVGPFDLAVNEQKCVKTPIHFPGLQTNGRNLWIGAEWTNNPGTPGVFLLIDESGSSRTPGRYGGSQGWLNLESAFPNYKHAGIRLVVEDGTTAPEPEADSETPSSSLVLPFFEVNTGNGAVTLYAVRNVSAQDIFFVTDITLNDGTFMPGAPVVLKAGATRTVNLGDVFGSGSGPRTGLIGFFVTNSSGTSLSTKALTGDFFLVDPVNDFAIGDPLPTKICNRSATRFASGGGVFDGTTFTFGVTNFDATVAAGTDGTFAPFVNARVFDESGVLFANVDLATSAGILKLTTADLIVAGVKLPAFGTIEWTFLSNRKGLITWSMNAESRFSIGMTASCLD